MENIIYVIEYHNGKTERKTEKELRGCIDDLIDDIKLLRKQYRWNKTLFRMILYTSDENFDANEYISHYKSLSTETYGPGFFNACDIEFIRKMNF